MSITLLCTIVLSSLVVSCGGKPAPAGDETRTSGSTPAAMPAADLIRLVFPSANQEIAAGTPVRVRFEPKGKTIPDSVEVYFGGKIFATIDDGGTEVLITEDNTTSTGIRAIKLMAYSGKTRPQSISTFITILSDIVPERYGYRVEKVFPHDVRAYTQGLLYHNGYIYEGTGLEGKSALRKTDIETGRVIRNHNLESRFFGEGITIHGNQIYQLTWKTKVGFVYDLETFRELSRFYYNTEGWGLTTMGDRLVMSDGTNKLYVIEPVNFTIVGTIEVYDNKSMVMHLNELEYINGEIWANVYMTDLIARIDPSTGKVNGYVDLADIMPASERQNDGDDVLNGIAWDNETGRIFVTGKNWPKLFQIRVIDPTSASLNP